MADEYIRRENAKDALQEKVFHNLTDEFYGAIQAIDELPSADVASVIHAHWETDKHAALDFCSSCGEAVERYVTAEQMDKSNYKGATYWNYCPHCGAKMDEVVE